MAGRARKLGAVQYRMMISAAQCSSSSTQASFSLSSLLPACVHCVVSLVLAPSSGVANAPQSWPPRPFATDMFSCCGQQTAFGLLLPLRCVCHTASLRSLRSGSCTCLERDHACILAAPVGLD
jgi:hypothetical protein